MRIRPSGLMVLALAIAAPVIARGAVKLDDDDNKFLLLVEPIILDDEESTYKKLKDKDDRLEFQKIFWARRDPNLKTPQNEFQDKYLKDQGHRGRALRDPRTIPGPAGPTTADACSSCSASPIRSSEDNQMGHEAGWPPHAGDVDLPRQAGPDVRGRQSRRSRVSDQCWGNENLDYQLDRIAK